MPAVPRLSKETSIYKPDAIGDGIDGAAQTATSYLSESATDGLMVHPSNDPSTGVKVAGSVDILRSGVSTANFGGVDGSTVRIGEGDAGHLTITPSEIVVYSADGYAPVFISHGTYDDETSDYSSEAKFGGFSNTAESTHIEHRSWESQTYDVAAGASLSLAGQYVWADYRALGTTTVQRLFIESPQVFVQDPRKPLTARSSNPTGRSLQLGMPVVVESTDTVSVANSTNTTLASVELPAGTWLVTVSVLFGSSATGRRVVYLSDDASVSSVDVSQDASVLVPAVSGGTTKTSSSAIVTHDATTTYYCRTWQNSGSALSVSAHVKAVRLT